MIRHILPFALCCLTVALPTWGQENSSGQKIAARVAPLNAHNAIGIAHVDLSKADVSAAMAWAVQASLDDRENVEAMGRKLQELATKLKAAGAREIDVVFYPPRATDLSYLPVDVAVVVATGPNNAKAVAEVIRPLLPEHFYGAQEQGDTVIVALSDRLKSLAMDAKPSEAVAVAFDATKPAPVRIIAQLPNDLKRVIRETFPKLPDELGGLTGSDVADGIRWVTLSVDSPPHFELNIEARTTNGDVSKSLAKLIDGGAKMLGRMAVDSPELLETKGIWRKLLHASRGTRS